MPSEVRSFIAGQLGLLWDLCERYPWDSRTRDQHRTCRTSPRDFSPRRG